MEYINIWNDYVSNYLWRIQNLSKSHLVVPIKDEISSIIKAFMAIQVCEILGMTFTPLYDYDRIELLKCEMVKMKIFQDKELPDNDNLHILPEKPLENDIGFLEWIRDCIYEDDIYSSERVFINKLILRFKGI